MLFRSGEKRYGRGADEDTIRNNTGGVPGRGSPLDAAPEGGIYGLRISGVHLHRGVRWDAGASAGSAEIDFPIDAPGFVRAEIYRALIPGLPPLPVLVSNPIWVT